MTPFHEGGFLEKGASAFKEAVKAVGHQEGLLTHKIDSLVGSIEGVAVHALPIAGLILASKLLMRGVRKEKRD